MLKTIGRGQSIETLMTTVIGELGIRIVSDRWLLVVKVGVGINYLATLITLLRILPCKVLKGRKHIALVIANY